MAHSLYRSSPYQSAVHPFPSMIRPVAAASHNAPRSVGEPNYRARRACAAALTLVAATLLVAALILLAGLGGRPASASQAEPATSEHATVYVASPGDSLWSIAQAKHGAVGLDRYVDALIDLNGGTDIQAGQAIRLP